MVFQLVRCVATSAPTEICPDRRTHHPECRWEDCEIFQVCTILRWQKQIILRLCAMLLVKSFYRLIAKSTILDSATPYFPCATWRPWNCLLSLVWQETVHVWELELVIKNKVNQLANRLGSCSVDRFSLFSFRKSKFL